MERKGKKGKKGKKGQTLPGGERGGYKNVKCTKSKIDNIGWAIVSISVLTKPKRHDTNHSGTTHMKR